MKYTILLTMISMFSLTSYSHDVSDKRKLIANHNNDDSTQITFYKSIFGKRKIKNIKYFRQGQQDSIEFEYFKNGKYKYTYHFTKGLKEGLYIEYYSNGRIKSTSFYKEDTLEGLYMSYYNDKLHSLHEICIYKNNLIEDSLLAFYKLDRKMKNPNGSYSRLTKKITRYYHGRLNGWALYFRKDGSVEAKILYKDGLSIQYYDYDHKGNVTGTGYYK